MCSSSDWAQQPNGSWMRNPVQKTRGLNRNHNRHLKSVFKGAATTVICAKRRQRLWESIRATARERHQTKSGQTDHRSKSCVNDIGNLEKKRGVRGEGRRSNKIERLARRCDYGASDALTNLFHVAKTKTVRGKASIVNLDPSPVATRAEVRLVRICSVGVPNVALAKEAQIAGWSPLLWQDKMAVKSEATQSCQQRRRKCRSLREQNGHWVG